MSKTSPWKSKASSSSTRQNPEATPPEPKQPPQKKRRRRKKRKGPRLIRINRLNNHFLACVLTDRHKSRKVTDLAGFRVVRVIGALYDRKLRQVVKVKARLFGGNDPARWAGWNGPKVVIDERRLFTGTPGRGVALDGGEIVSVDLFVRRPKGTRPRPHLLQEWIDTMKRRKMQAEPPQETAEETPDTGPPVEEIDDRGDAEVDAAIVAAGGVATAEILDDQDPLADVPFEDDPDPNLPVPAEVYDPSQIPALSVIQLAADAPGLAELTQKLDRLLALKPALLEEMEAGVPRWWVKCPDDALLDVCGYGPARPRPVDANDAQVVGYMPAPSGAEPPVELMGGDMPTATVLRSVKRLLQKYESDLKWHAATRGVAQRPAPEPADAEPPDAEPPKKKPRGKKASGMTAREVAEAPVNKGGFAAEEQIPHDTPPATIADDDPFGLND